MCRQRAQIRPAFYGRPLEKHHHSWQNYRHLWRTEAGVGRPWLHRLGGYLAVRTPDTLYLLGYVSLPHTSAKSPMQNSPQKNDRT